MIIASFLQPEELETNQYATMVNKKEEELIAKVMEDMVPDTSEQPLNRKLSFCQTIKVKIASIKLGLS